MDVEPGRLPLQQGETVVQRAIFIMEIFRNICCFSACADLASLAQCCRAFQEAALDALWYKLYDLNPLLRCLPHDALKIVGRIFSEYVRIPSHHPT